MTATPPQTNDATGEVVAAEPYESNELLETNESGEIPCIQLEAVDEENVDNFDERVHIGKKAPVVAVAESIETSVRDMEVQGGYSTRKLDYSDKRAEFVSVSFLKDRADIALGITLKSSPIKGEVRIASVKEDSLAHDSPLRANDKILSINNKDCAKLDHVVVAEILHESVGSVTLVCHNEGGVSEYVESMVMKSSPTEKVGVSLQKLSSGSLKLSKIRPGSKFSLSLLNPGDLALSINGTACSHLEAEAAAALIEEDPRKVTILAKTLRETGVVVAQISDRLLAASSVPVLNANQGARHNANNSTGDDTKTAKMCGCILFVVVALGLGIALGVASIEEEEDTYYVSGNDDFWNNNNSNNNDIYTTNDIYTDLFNINSTTDYTDDLFNNNS